MNKYTVGPLRMNRLASGTIVIESDQEVRRVATFHHQGNPEADARLFLAAPDLLESLQELLQAVEDHRLLTVAVPMAIGASVSRAQKAIAKASGK